MSTTDDTISKGPAMFAEKASFSDRVMESKLRATDFSKLVNVEGKRGLFTPLIGPGGGEASVENQEQIIQLLRNQLVELQNENQTLRQELRDIAKARRRTQDDFASAISHSVDNLQAHLYDIKTPVSRFAMREFKIEANVHVGVSSLGTVECKAC